MQRNNMVTIVDENYFQNKNGISDDNVKYDVMRIYWTKSMNKLSVDLNAIG